jgi:hypothetical protein
MHALFDEPLEVSHAGMARDQVGKTRGNADKRLSDFALGKSGRVEQCPMGHAFKAFFYNFTSHTIPLLDIYIVMVNRYVNPGSE